MKKNTVSRRQFVKNSATASACALALGSGLTGASPVIGAVRRATEQDESDGSNRGRILKSVKWGMIGTGGSVVEKFQLMKDLGYDGIELVGPNMLDPNEVREASRQTEMPVHGLVNMKHWDAKFRLSSPDPKAREAGVSVLETCLENAKAFGGGSVLLVPGRVSKEETHQNVWDRSIAEIKKVIPLAAKLDVRVLIENVWNGFCETPDEFKDYLDAINSPWVGAYFDIGNVRKFGPSEDWIRTLGNRIVKLDCKDWGKKNGFCKIGDGDVNWPEVCKALDEIGFAGWCTAEVGGGKRERLTDIANRMNRCLNL